MSDIVREFPSLSRAALVWREVTFREAMTHVAGWRLVANDTLNRPENVELSESKALIFTDGRREAVIVIASTCEPIDYDDWEATAPKSWIGE